MSIAAVWLLGALQASAVISSDSTVAQRFKAIPWQEAGTTGSLGNVAEVRVPQGCKFTGMAGTQTFMELTENQSSPTEEGTILCRDGSSESDGFWFVVFSFEARGYVADTERDALDSDGMLASLKRGSETGNKARRERGWETLTLLGWDRAPFYDPRTNNLTWATLLRAEDGSVTVNHSIRLLGRAGVMNLDLVAAPGQKLVALPALDSIIAGFAYLPGQRYAEWRQGEKVAAVGLTGLVVGGAGAVAAKTGLLGQLGKLVAAAGKLLLAVVVAALAGIKALFTRKKQPHDVTSR